MSEPMYIEKQVEQAHQAYVAIHGKGRFTNLKFMVEHGFDALKGYVDRNLLSLLDRINKLEQRLEEKNGGFRGKYQHLQDYSRGAIVLHSNGLWAAIRDTHEEPGLDASDWQPIMVAVKP